MQLQSLTIPFRLVMLAGPLQREVSGSAVEEYDWPNLSLAHVAFTPCGGILILHRFVLFSNFSKSDLIIISYIASIHKPLHSFDCFLQNA